MMNKIYSKFELTFFWLIYCAVLFVVQTLFAQSARPTTEQYELVRLLNTPADFSGWAGPTTKDSSLKAIKIGLFMPANLNVGVRNAAHLAILELNNSGGYKGIPFRLISRWASEPWGAGSKEMINLIYQDSVWAIIGSVDGAVTHIAEQIVTKSWLPLIAPVSADLTLNYINIPWMFRLPPDYRIQSVTIMEQGIRKQSLVSVGLVTSNDHDGRIFSEEMLEVLSENNYTPLFHFEIPEAQIDHNKIITRINKFSPDGLVIYLSPQHILSLLSGLSKNKNKIICFIPWIPGLDIKDLSDKTDMYFCYLEPFSTGKNNLYNRFAANYFRRYGQYPAADAAYAYDAVYILARALDESGLNRAKLREAIAQAHDISGVTGKINWDNGGGNITTPILRISEKTN